MFLLFDSGMGEGFFRGKIQLLSYICVCFIVWYGAGISIGGVGGAVGGVPCAGWKQYQKVSNAIFFLKIILFHVVLAVYHMV